PYDLPSFPTRRSSDLVHPIRGPRLLLVHRSRAPSRNGSGEREFRSRTCTCNGWGGGSCVAQFSSRSLRSTDAPRLRGTDHRRCSHRRRSGKRAAILSRRPPLPRVLTPCPPLPLGEGERRTSPRSRPITGTS